MQFPLERDFFFGRLHQGRAYRSCTDPIPRSVNAADFLLLQCSCWLWKSTGLIGDMLIDIRRSPKNNWIPVSHEKSGVITHLPSYYRVI